MVGRDGSGPVWLERVPGSEVPFHCLLGDLLTYS